MNDYLDFSIQMKTSEVSYNRKAFRSQFALVLLNASLIVLNSYLFKSSEHWYNLVAVGMLMGNLIWTVLFMFDHINDLNSAKRELAYLRQRRDEEAQSGVVDQYDSIRDHLKHFNFTKPSTFT